jgi:hypothetical protein
VKGGDVKAEGPEGKGFAGGGGAAAAAGAAVMAQVAKRDATTDTMAVRRWFTREVPFL